MLDKRKNNQALLERLKFPVLLWGQKGILEQTNKKYLLIAHRKTYPIDPLTGGRYIDAEGHVYRINATEVGEGVSLLLFAPLRIILPFLFGKEMLVDWTYEGQVEFLDFREEVTDFILKKKWYAVSDPAWSREDKIAHVLKAKTTDNFADLYTTLDFSLSHKLMKAIFDA